MSTQAQISDDILLDRMMDALEAIQNNDDARVREITRTIPLTPIVAKRMKHYMSTSSICDLGFDMSLVEAEFGKDWFDEP